MKMHLIRQRLVSSNWESLSIKEKLLQINLVCFLYYSSLVNASSQSFTPSFSSEIRYFPEKPAFVEQFNHFQSSVILSGEGRWTSGNRKKRVRFEPFFRIDGQDSERTHIDLRELTYSQKFKHFDMLIGNAQIFWGTVESRNIVDVINQFDLVENNNETEKLGQPLLRIGKFTRIGRFETYYLPYFRERTFPGLDGRQRTEFVVDASHSKFDRDGDQWAGDLAFRYKHQLDKFDIGAHVFYGTARSPRLKLNHSDNKLIPVYQELIQVDLDLQWTSNAWLLKFEGIVADQASDHFVSIVSGFEYTYFDLSGSGIDLDCADVS